MTVHSEKPNCFLFYLLYLVVLLYSPFSRHGRYCKAKKVPVRDNLVFVKENKDISKSLFLQTAEGLFLFLQKNKQKETIYVNMHLCMYASMSAHMHVHTHTLKIVQN